MIAAELNKRRNSIQAPKEDNVENQWIWDIKGKVVLKQRVYATSMLTGGSVQLYDEMKVTAKGLARITVKS